jgi:hypothetical protein
LAVSPSPSPTPHKIAIPAPSFPTEKLHAEYVVEVNKKGQVVKIKSGHGTRIGTFNAQTFGNALQMWIRKPDGTAEVGLYRVTYDYDPKTHHVRRGVSLVSAGGSWGNVPGAAQQMIETAEREAAQAKQQQQQQQQQQPHSKLPSLNQITGKKTPSPSPTIPFFSPHP